MLLDTLSTALGLFLAGTLRPLLNSVSILKDVTEPALVPSALYILFPVVWVVIFASLSIYDGRRFLRAADELAALFLSTFIASISTAGILYFSYRDVSRALFLLFITTTFLFCFSWRVLARLYFRSRRESPTVKRRLLVVGSGPLGQNVGKQIQGSLSDNLALVGYVDDENSLRNQARALGKLAELKTVLGKYDVTDVVIALPYSAYHQMTEIVACLDDQPVGVWIALGFFDLALYRTDIEDFAGIPMLDLRASAIDDYQRLMKRAFDLGFALLALIPALPVMGLLALMIILEDGAPVLFRQKRVGENGRLFEMLKFRTMVSDAEADKHELVGSTLQRSSEAPGLFKIPGDPRTTAIGETLRRWSIDELPQLWNVLRGDMSLVGPRPLIPEEAELVGGHYRARLNARPGITGPWQTLGRSDIGFEDMVKLDYTYVMNWSFPDDLKLLIRTVGAVLRRRGAY
jgi:exopolysaccharide biosynthesis polyprenyl glycosylphosphotransferase